MSPLMIRISLGMEDDRLLEHIEFLDRASKTSARISPMEIETLAMLHARLDEITEPKA